MVFLTGVTAGAVLGTAAPTAPAAAAGVPAVSHVGGGSGAKASVDPPDRGSIDARSGPHDPLPLDPQTWSWLALRDRHYARALEWVGSTLAVTDDATATNSQVPAGMQIGGSTFSTASKTSTASYNGIPVDYRGVWLEGTAPLATSLPTAAGGVDRRNAEGILQQVRIAQHSLGFGAGGTARLRLPAR